MEIKDMFFELGLDIWSQDADITPKRLKEEVIKRIENLKSYLSRENYKHLTQLGVKQSLPYEESIEITQKQITDYETFLEWLNNEYKGD